MIITLMACIILQWNAQSLLAHSKEFKNAINSWTPKPDIICIQQSWLKEGKTYNLPGYDIYRHDRNITKSKKCGGGCAICIKRGLIFKYRYTSGSDTPVECQVGELYDDRKNKINLINIYNPCTTLNTKSLNEIFEKIDKPCIVCGDLNCHNPLWGSSKLDHNGQTIEDVITSNNLVCINSGEGTRVNSSHGTLFCIDVTFSSPRIAAKCNWTILNDTWGSDHCQILIELNMPIYTQLSQSHSQMVTQKSRLE